MIARILVRSVYTHSIRSFLDLRSYALASLIIVGCLVEIRSVTVVDNAIAIPQYKQIGATL